MIPDPVSYFEDLKVSDDVVKSAFFEHELQKKPAELLFSRIVKEYGPRKNTIIAFNHWIKNILPLQLMLKVESDQTGIYWFQNVRLLKPELGGKPMFPRDARKGGHTYAGRLVVDACRSYPEGQIKAIQKIKGIDEIPVPEGDGEICVSKTTGRVGRMVNKNLTLGEIPIMLGSESCHLHGYSHEEIRKVGEDANDPFGYFIIKGGERMIIIQENLCFSQPVSKFEEKTTINERRIETRVTTPSLAGSTVVSINMGKTWPVVRVVVKQAGFKNATVSKYSMFSIYDALFQMSEPSKYAYDPIIFPEECSDMNDGEREKRRSKIVEKSVELIKRFILPENYEKLQSFFTASIAKYDTIEWPVREIINRRKSGTAIQHAAAQATLGAIRRAAATRLSISSNGASVNNEDIQDAINAMESVKKTFEKINSKDIQAKTILIDLFKDFFSNTESQDFERKIILFSRVIAQHMMVVAGERTVDDRDGWEIKRVKLPVDWFSQTFNGIFKIVVDKGGLLRFVQNLIKPFLNMFSPASVTGRESMIHMVKRDTPVALISQVGRINVTANRQSKQFSLRLLQPSQVGYVCVAETPCSDACGLTKNLACSAWIALRRDEYKYINEIANPIMEKYGSKNYDSEKYPHSIFVDNYLIGWGFGPDIEKHLRIASKRRMDFFDICIIYNPVDRLVDVFTSGSRPTRPLFTVDEEAEMLNIDKLPKDAYNWPIEKLIEDGIIEYIHAAEQQYIRVSETPEKVREILKERKENPPPPLGYLKLYSEISAIALLGEAASLMPMPNTCQGPRVTYQSSMIGQALGAYHDSYYDRKDTMFKRIEGTRATYETAVSGSIGLNRAPTGRMFIIAFLALANNGEDGIIFKREALERLKMTKYSTRKIIAKGTITGVKNLNIENEDNKPAVETVKQDETIQAAISAAASSGKLVEEFVLPAAGREDSIGTQDYLKYHAIQENGMPRLGAIISKGNCIIGRTRTFVDISGRETTTNTSEMAGVGDEGIVDSVEITEGRDGERYARVRIRQTRNIIAGDKMASRYSQKGTISTKRSNISGTEPGTGNEYEIARARSLALLTGGEKALREAIVNEGARGISAEEAEREIVGVRFAKDIPRVSSGPNKGMTPDVCINSHAIPSRMTMAFLGEVLLSKAAMYTGERIDGTAFTDFLGTQLEKAQAVLAENGLDPNGYEEMEHPDGTPLKCKVFMGPCYYQFLRHVVSDKIQYRSKGNIVLLTRQPVHGRSKEGGLRQGEMERSAMCSWGATDLVRERLMLASDVYPYEICTTCGNQARTNHRIGSKECPVCPMGKENIGIVETPFIHILISRMVASLGIQSRLVRLEKITKAEDY